jgi:hypothetical protein
MAKNYKIKVKVEIVESEQAVGAEPVQTGAGEFEWVISAGQGQSIDQCEQALVCPGSHRLLAGPEGSPVVVRVRPPRSRQPEQPGD